MSGVGAAVGLASAVIGGASGIIGSGNAAKEQEKGLMASIAFQKESRDMARSDLAPWRDTGQQALDKLWKMIQAGPGEFTASPGYQFRLAEGKRAIENAATARKDVLSPWTTSALMERNQDVASAEYQNFLASYYQSLSPYSGLSTAGQNAAAGQANITMKAGENISQSLQDIGQAKATGEINKANAISGAAQNAFANYMFWRNSKAVDDDIYGNRQFPNTEAAGANKLMSYDQFTMGGAKPNSNVWR
jgi:hypothetical protein